MHFLVVVDVTVQVEAVILHTPLVLRRRASANIESLRTQFLKTGQDADKFFRN